MIFGRKKSTASDIADSSIEDDDNPGPELTDSADENEEGPDKASDGTGDEAELDEWAALDAQEWRDEGPFDISEVDLDADEVVRLDLGSLILTPFEGMQLQLQVDEASQQVNAVLVTKDESGLELALFAAPRSASLLADVRDEMIADTESSGGTVTLTKGPFGTEIRRVLPVTGPKKERLLHVSRTWMVQGPRWLLRGVVMGKAGQQPGTDGPCLELFEFFANVVVRRGNEARAAGDLIPMTFPEGLAPGQS